MPRYKHLAASYVDWLGLEVVPMLVQDWAAVWVSEHTRKPKHESTFVDVAFFEGFMFVASDDGLAYDWAGA